MAVWYVAYGSNLGRSRFACYLQGGTPPHATAANPGARDPSPPIADRATTLPGTVWFGSYSRRWDGAVAFYDGALPRGGGSRARAYLLEGSQLLDVAAQELGRAPGAFEDLPMLGPGEVHELDAGRYGTLAGCEPIDGVAAMTLTAPWGLQDPAATSRDRPAGIAYLRTIAEGLLEVHGLDAAGAAAYLADLPGVGWSQAALAAALRA